MLYQGIARLLPFSVPRVIQFTATSPGAGTSHIAAQFALLVAQRARGPVLLLDAGHRPAARVASRMDLLTAPARPADRSIESAICRLAGMPNLFFARPPASPEFTAYFDEPWAEVLAEARRMFSLVVIDSPSLATHPEAAALARHADGYVLIAKSQRTRGKAFDTARQTIDRLAGAEKLLGVVLNKHKVRFGSRSRRAR